MDQQTPDFGYPTTPSPRVGDEPTITPSPVPELPSPQGIDPVVEAAGAPAPFVPVYRNVLLQPDEAQRLLARKFQNRRVVKAHLTYLAEKMKRDEWRLNAECVSFSPSGDLLNGQNRLDACVIANVPIPVTLAFNVDPSTVVTMDTGKIRSLGEVLGAMGRRADMSGGLQFFYEVRLEQTYAESGTPAPTGRVKVSMEQYLDLLAAEPDFEGATHAARSITRSVAGLSTPAVHAAYHLTTLEDPANAASFWDGIATGAGLATTDVRYQFRKWHQDKMALTDPSKRPSKGHYFVALMRAWGLYLGGKSATTRTWTWRPSKGLLVY